MAHSDTAQQSKVAASYKGDSINYKGPMLHGPMKFVDGVHADTKAKMGHTGIIKQNVEVPWFGRRN
jgi:hypothetical protein